MNKQQKDILNILFDNRYKSQRELSEMSGHSLGVVNASLKALMKDGYIDEDMGLTDEALKEFEENSPKRAVILAAGYGMRMVPINTETPKGLIEVNGETLIERIIKQLHEAGIKEIYVVVGFLKEKYEYLMDEYGVELIVNEEYGVKNNLYSLSLALSHISNAYIIPCDVWCDKNPFSPHELYSWYMVSDLVDDESTVRINRKMELVTVSKSAGGNAMVGISYLCGEDSSLVKERIEKFSKDPRFDGAFWEEALYGRDKMIVFAKVVHSSDVVEINTYEQLRDLDSSSNQLQAHAISVIENALHAERDEITDITVLKKGMTNRSFLFSVRGVRYIMRIPGEGTDKLIDRNQEAAVYNAIKDKHICDDIIYINPKNGYKITKYIEDARTCDAFDRDDLKKCMKVLRNFHEMGLKTGHDFDIFRQIEFYESLWNGEKSIYRDYEKVKKNVLSLRPYIEKHAEKKVLTHIDAVPDNFLISKEKGGKESIRLIDWEYAGMQDPHVDIAMFSIYALYDRKHVDELIDLYFEEGCPFETRIKIYAYIAACGLLWSNWCEYKRNLGVEFGEYSLRQYRYAKDYYRIVSEELKMGDEV